MQLIFRLNEGKSSIFWLTNLRWIAVVSVIVIIIFVHLVLGLEMALLPLAVISVLIVLYNIVFITITSSLENKEKLSRKWIDRIINIQVICDWISLSLLLHFSGGVENPFMFYFIFHIIISSVLISRKAAFVQASFASLLFLLIIFLEYFGILAHYRLDGFVPVTIHSNLLYITWVGFAFVSTIFIVAYMTTAVSQKLREDDAKLIRANQQLLEKDKIKNSYVLRVTHDIKGHISAIDSCIAPVLEGFTGELNEKQTQLLTRAHERTGTCFNYIQELLKLTKIKLMNKLEFEPVQLLEVIESLRPGIEDLARAKEITFTLKLPVACPFLSGIPLYLKELLLNLLTNAVKYTPEKGEVTLSVRERDSRLELLVSDSGIGIPSADIPRIFEEFFRAANANTIEKHGTGLGLSFCKQIVDVHHGEISVDSVENHGTSFKIFLPL